MNIETKAPVVHCDQPEGQEATPPRESYHPPTLERMPLDAVVRYEAGSGIDGFGGFIPIP